MPVLTPTLSSYWVELVTPVRYELAQPLIEGLRNDTVVGDDSAQEAMPIRLTPFDDAVLSALYDSTRTQAE